MTLAAAAHALAVAASGALAWRVLRTAPTPARSWFLPFVALVLWWALIATLAALSLASSQALALERLSFVSAALTPVAWFAFVDAFVGRGGRVQRRAALLALLPLATIVVATLEPRLGWLLLSDAAPGSERGWWFWLVHVPYSYLLIALGALTVWRGRRSRSRTVRRQLRWLLTAAAFPLAGNLLDLAGWRPLPGLEWTVVGFTVAAALLAVAITARRFLRLPPTSYRDRFAAHALPVLFLDADWRVLDRNDAAAALLPQLDDGAPPLGRALPSVAAALHELPHDGVRREVRAPSLPGKRAWVACTPLREGERQPYGYVVEIEPLPEAVTTSPGGPPSRT